MAVFKNIKSVSLVLSTLDALCLAFHYLLRASIIITSIIIYVTFSSLLRLFKSS